MSFICPRSDVSGYANRLKGKERKILEVRPSTTGPANLKYSIEEKILVGVHNPREYNDEVISPDKVRVRSQFSNSKK